MKNWISTPKKCIFAKTITQTQKMNNDSNSNAWIFTFQIYVHNYSLDSKEIFLGNSVDFFLTPEFKI